MKRKSLGSLAVIGALLMLEAFPVSDVSASEVQQLIAAAKEKGETVLNLSWGQQSMGGSKGAKRFEALFNRMYGTNVKVNFTPGPSMPRIIGKVTQELAAGTKASTDVLLGTESHYGSLMKKSVMEPYNYRKLSARITDEVMAPRNIGVEVATFISGIVYNTQIVSPAEAPKHLKDVLNPKWKGKIASTPYAAQFDRIALLPGWGNEKMKGFITKLSNNVGGLIRCGEISRITSGEFVMMAMGCGSYAVRLEQAKGAPLGHVILQDGGTISFFYWGVPQNATAPNLAKLFINMAMSEEGQKVVYKNYATDHHALPGSQWAAELKGYKDRNIPILEVDAQYVADHPEQRKLGRALSKILRKKR